MCGAVPFFLVNGPTFSHYGSTKALSGLRAGGKVIPSITCLSFFSGFLLVVLAPNEEGITAAG